MNNDTIQGVYSNLSFIESIDAVERRLSFHDQGRNVVRSDDRTVRQFIWPQNELDTSANR